MMNLIFALIRFGVLIVQVIVSVQRFLPLGQLILHHIVLNCLLLTSLVFWNLNVLLNIIS